MSLKEKSAFYKPPMVGLLTLSLLAVTSCASSSSPASDNARAPAPRPLETQPAHPAPMPDLTIRDVKVEPTPHVVQGRAVLVRGREYSFSVKVSNQGRGRVPGAAAVSVAYGCSGPGVGGQESVVAAGPIGSGQSRFSNSFLINIPVQRAPGTCSFTFTVDTDDIYTESDETNNVWRTTVSVH